MYLKKYQTKNAKQFYIIPKYLKIKINISTCTSIRISTFFRDNQRVLLLEYLLENQLSIKQFRQITNIQPVALLTHQIRVLQHPQYLLSTQAIHLIPDSQIDQEFHSSSIPNGNTNSSSHSPIERRMTN